MLAARSAHAWSNFLHAHQALRLAHNRVCLGKRHGHVACLTLHGASYLRDITCPRVSDTEHASFDLEVCTASGSTIWACLLEGGNCDCGTTRDPCCELCFRDIASGKATSTARACKVGNGSSMSNRESPSCFLKATNPTCVLRRPRIPSRRNLFETNAQQLQLSERRQDLSKAEVGGNLSLGFPHGRWQLHLAARAHPHQRPA